MKLYPNMQLGAGAEFQFKGLFVRCGNAGRGSEGPSLEGVQSPSSSYPKEGLPKWNEFNCERQSLVVPRQSLVHGISHTRHSIQSPPGLSLRVDLPGWSYRAILPDWSPLLANGLPFAASNIVGETIVGETRMFNHKLQLSSGSKEDLHEKVDQ